MPLTSQALYFHLVQHADDDGIVEAYPVIRSTGANEDDLKILVGKGFAVVLNEDFVTYLPDWLEHNCIRADRKIDSIYKDLLLRIVPNAEIRQSKPNDDNDSVSGSADITNKVDVVMTYKRDKDLPENERLLTVSKNRLTGKLAVDGKAIHLYFDEASKRIGDDTAVFTVPYGWEEDTGGFISIEQLEQMEIPF